MNVEVYGQKFTIPVLSVADMISNEFAQMQQTGPVFLKRNKTLKEATGAQLYRYKKKMIHLF